MNSRAWARNAKSGKCVVAIRAATMYERALAFETKSAATNSKPRAQSYLRNRPDGENHANVPLSALRTGDFFHFYIQLTLTRA